MIKAMTASEDDVLKANLRRRLRALRQGLDGASAASALAEQVVTLPVMPTKAHTVAFYMPMGAELDPRPLVARIAAKGATLALPVTVARGQALIFRTWREGDGLAPDALGMAAPLDTAPPVHPDIILTPLVGFDRFGRRLGQGGGFYDRTLRELRALGSILAIGLAFAEQECDSLPKGPWDESLDGVLTPKGYRKAIQT